MKKKTANAAELLERIFHEPNRLAIMAVLCAADKGVSFSELKSECNLTDGNLNRHLKVLGEAGAIEIHKAFVDDKPRTTVFISAKGLARFEEYLDALGDMLSTARKAVSTERSRRSPAAHGRVVEA